MKVSILALALACTGCSLVFSLDPVGGKPDGSTGDGGPRPDVATTDDGQAAVCGGNGAFQLCVPASLVTGRLTFGATVDTDTDPQCATVAPETVWTNASDAPDTCLVIADHISGSSVLRVTGARPLVLFASQIQLGAIDVASHRDVLEAGAGARTSCAIGGVPADNANGGGGGAGGSFGGEGGKGGTGNANTAAGGTPGMFGPSVTLQGGCPGGTGGNGASTATSGARGGGAVYLVGIQRIEVNTINASGAGALGGTSRGGGAGGGAGGMIILWSNAKPVTGVVMANGGGGGGGAHDDSTTFTTMEGDPGEDPSPATPTAQAGGGVSIANGNGGNGAAGTNRANNGSDANAMTGGGGGGGGAGYILSNQPLDGVVSPPAVIGP